MTTNNLHTLLSENERIRHATDTGSRTHKKMQHIFIHDTQEQGDSEIIQNIKRTPGILKFFGPQSRAEVPVAGIVNGRFISRRIDRLYINNDTKTIEILDFKTDINKEQFHESYIFQLREYIALIRQIYPNHTVRAHILWTHDWALESI